MQNRVPVGRGERPGLPEFEPVPRRFRHDGWTPERQKAFIEALADTGCVSRAAAMVNMAQANCYTLRRAKGAEGFRRAWDAALDFGLARLKDIAFERAIEGEQVPVFVGGKLIGYRRKTNDALLMFCLRHYGQDAQGRRMTINYFSTRAEAGAGAAAGGAAGATTATGAGTVGTGAVAQASTTTVRTVISGASGDGGDREANPRRVDALADTLNGFDGVMLDAEASATIEAALLACAARARAAQALIEQGGEVANHAAMDDPAEPFVALLDRGNPYGSPLDPPVAIEDAVAFVAGEPPWQLAGDTVPEAWDAAMRGAAELRGAGESAAVGESAEASDTGGVSDGEGAG